MSQWQTGQRHDTERLGTADFAALSAAHGFERTTLGLLGAEERIRRAEEDAGTYWNPADQLGGFDAVAYDVSSLQLSHPHAMSEEAFRAEGFDRGGRIAWTPMTTRQRAEIEAETLDRRDREARLLALNADTLGRRALGFGASFLACMADPVNFVPVFGAAAKGAGLGARTLRGTAAGMGGATVADAALFPALARRGEDVGFADLGLDIACSGLFGGGFGAAGGILHNRRVAGLAGEQTRLAEMLRDAGFGEAEAGRAAARAIEHIADMPRREELARAVRGSTAGLDRLGAGKLLDRAMLAIRDGESLDVEGWARELNMGRAFARAETIRRERAELEAAYDRVRDHPLAGAPDEVLAALSPEDMERILIHHGPAMERNGEIVVQGRALLRETGSRSGYGLVKIIFGHGEKGNKTPAMPPVSREDVLALPDLVRDWRPVEVTEGENAWFVWRIPRGDGNHLVIVSHEGADGPDSRLVSMYVGDADKPASKRKARSDSSTTFSGGS